MVSLYDATVSSFVQTLGAVEQLLVRGLDHCREHSQSVDELLEARLCPDMYPLRFQVLQCIVSSAGAIEGLHSGVFRPFAHGSPSYEELQRAVAAARGALEAISPDEVNGFAARDVMLDAGEIKVPFTATDFLLSYALPNFYFHAATAYGILRVRNVPLGKRDFLRGLRRKPG